MLLRIREVLADFPGYAKIRRVARCPWNPGPSTTACMTPTLKIKRAAVLEHHRADIEGMYRS
jgi:long-chain acyl-CoA synthetase